MFGSNTIRDSSVDSNNNRVINSGNTTTNSDNLSINSGNTSRNSASENFQEFRVRVKLPFQRNPNFCGRNDILQELHRILHRPKALGNDSVRETVILHGMGGIGKSQIALEYAQRFGPCYTSIFWIDADDSSRTTDSACKVVEQLVAHYAHKWRSAPDYQEIANILGIPGKIDSSGRITQDAMELAMEMVHAWLAADGNRGWLLLIDNKDKVKAGDFDTILPTCNWGSVIITSRLSNLHRYGECIAVEGIGAQAGLELLLRISGKNRNLSESELEEARQIVKELGELPLALDQAGAYIAELQITFAIFRQKMNDAFNDTLDTGLPSERASIRTTWELSFRELSPEARQILHLCAFLSNEDIPDELFRRGKGAVPWMVEDGNKLDKAIRSLFIFSFAKRKDTGDSFWIHPLVHVWAREHTDRSTQRQNVEDTITLVASAIVKDEHERRTEDWIFERRILNHLKVCQEHISEFSSELDNVKTAEALSSIASAYENLGFDGLAEESCQQAITTYEMALGKDHPSSLDTLHCMGTILSKQKRYDESLEFSRRALSGKEKAFGKDHPATLRIVNDIALVLGDKGELDESLKLYYRALDGRERALGNDHRETLETVHNIAYNFLDQGRLDEALEWCRRALEGEEKLLGRTDHPDALLTVECMGSIFYNLGRYEEALEWHLRVLAGREKTLGNDHPLTLATVCKISDVFYSQERHNEALEWHRRLLAGREKSFGKDHPETLTTVLDIAQILYNQKRFDEALEWLRRVLVGREKVLGKNHPETLTIALNIAEVFYHQKRFDEALEWDQKALAGYETVLGKDHPETLTAVHNIAVIFNIYKRYDEALEWHRRELGGREKALGNDHPFTLTTVQNISEVFYNQKRFDEALEWLLRVLAGREKVLGNNHPETLTTVHGIATVFYHQKRYDEALEWYRRALAGRENAHGNDHPETLTVVHNIAEVFYTQKRFDDALEWLRRILAGREKAFGNNHPETLTTVHNIAEVFYNQERYDDALDWLRRALAGRETALGKDHPSTLSTREWMASVFKKLVQRKKSKQLEKQDKQPQRYPKTAIIFMTKPFTNLHKHSKLLYKYTARVKDGNLRVWMLSLLDRDSFISTFLHSLSISIFIFYFCFSLYRSWFSWISVFAEMGLLNLNGSWKR
ncbi:hypothetical protein RUND412_004596 [Rhizina undulata]